MSEVTNLPNRDRYQDAMLDRLRNLIEDSSSRILRSKKYSDIQYFKDVQVMCLDVQQHLQEQQEPIGLDLKQVVYSVKEKHLGYKLAEAYKIAQKLNKSVVIYYNTVLNGLQVFGPNYTSLSFKFFQTCEPVNNIYNEVDKDIRLWKSKDPICGFIIT